ncbi:MAG: queuosine precursor transporter [Candidatus Melainabacteria bacterium]|nr:queuosine precursor transporter [Candidatus Melainabacteria bacterium]
MRSYKYLDVATVIFVVVLLLSNFIAVNKISQIGEFVFGSGVMFFPVSYLLGDILTEVYGYSKSRRVIWLGFGVQIFATFAVYVIVNLPPASIWPNQDAYEIVFNNVPRTVLASMLAYFSGEFSNSYVMAKMKIWTKGKFLFTRTIGSTIVGEGVDTLVFYPLALGGLLAFPWPLILKVMIANYILKVLWEIIATPVTYKIVAFLKKVEKEDYYDYKTNFNPFVVKND